jgi:hypothetical protein
VISQRFAVASHGKHRAIVVASEATWAARLTALPLGCISNWLGSGVSLSLAVIDQPIRDSRGIRTIP